MMMMMMMMMMVDYWNYLTRQNLLSWVDLKTLHSAYTPPPHSIR